jgi:hypothetical protein
MSTKFDSVVKLAFHTFRYALLNDTPATVVTFVLQINRALLAKQRGTFCFENKVRRAIIKSKTLLAEHGKVSKPNHQKLYAKINQR